MCSRWRLQWSNGRQTRFVPGLGLHRVVWAQPDGVGLVHNLRRQSFVHAPPANAQPASLLVGRLSAPNWQMSCGALRLVEPEPP